MATFPQPTDRAVGTQYLGRFRRQLADAGLVQDFHQTLISILPEDLLEQYGAGDDVGPAFGLECEAALGQIDGRQLEEVPTQEQSANGLGYNDRNLYMLLVGREQHN